jgi:3-oxoacyl-[acyl-carrier protein] reductase
MAGQETQETAYVTGAAQGIGLSIVERLAEDGFQCMAVDLQTEEVEKQADAMRHKGLSVNACGLDVCDRSLVSRSMENFDRLDTVVCAAAVYWPKTIYTATEDDFRKTMEVNLIGSFIVAQEALRRMKRGGRIIFISSRAVLGGKGFPHYIASKAALIGLTRAMAVELRPKGIMVNSVAPGFTDTPMTRSMPIELYAQAEASEPSGKAADPAEIANAVSFLASPRTSFINGQVLFVDGGKSIGVLNI